MPDAEFWRGQRHRPAILPVILLSVAACSNASAPTIDLSAVAHIAPPTAVTTQVPPAPVPDDWERFEGGTITIAVPPQYVGGDPADDQTLASMRALGGACADAADLIDEFRDNYEFAAIEGDLCARAVARTVHVLAVPSSTTTPSAFAEELVSRLGPNSSLIDFKEGAIGGQPSALMQIRQELPVGVTTQAVYAVRTGRAWHIILGATLEDDVAAAMPTFDAIAATFRAR